MGTYLTPLQRKNLGIDIPAPESERVLTHEESKQQIACVEWFRYQYSVYASLLFAIPNGGKRSKIEAGIMKAEGVRKGVWDMFLMLPRGRYHGMWIEQKVDGGSLSEAQVDFLYDAMDNGYHVAVVWTKSEFMDAINWYLNL